METYISGMHWSKFHRAWTSSQLLNSEKSLASQRSCLFVALMESRSPPTFRHKPYYLYILAFTPATEQRLGKHCNIPVAKRAPETLFEPDTPISYPSDIWSLGVAIWEILGMKAIFSESEPQDEVVAQQIDVLGSQWLPPSWLRDWERSHGDQRTPRQPTGDRETRPPLQEAFEDFIQKYRRKREGAGTFEDGEKQAILDLMRRMLKFRPEERLTIDEVLQSEWMVKWALPQLEGSPKVSPLG
ncbi:hypothetical protein Cob_v006509 [Colletotrichum orbiculare MAFF 240422]|uniref:Protein kinase domain-containing protein n=1 Tax=Colletotrichum orbiculare (strain 104-T / ATCC 96160 / CBS 514.97 / LARS 414 / MAFF 240422) TaxID=1213857 RepID=A0A484FT70_COLOR|nr:hypothetical protein Cob_v006509 [Colletotrichum orbiculare MAFF 240422]